MENTSQLNHLIEGLRREFKPSTTHQEFLIGQMAQVQWRLALVDRLDFVAIEVLSFGTNSLKTPDHKLIASMMKSKTELLTQLRRMREPAERSYYRALRELRRSLAGEPKQKSEPKTKQEFPAMLEKQPMQPKSAPQTALRL